VRRVWAKLPGLRKHSTNGSEPLRIAWVANHCLATGVARFGPFFQIPSSAAATNLAVVAPRRATQSRTEVASTPRTDIASIRRYWQVVAIVAAGHSAAERWQGRSNLGFDFGNPNDCCSPFPRWTAPLRTNRAKAPVSATAARYRYAASTDPSCCWFRKRCWFRKGYRSSSHWTNTLRAA